MVIAPSTCRRCLYREDHPLGLVLDDDSICSGCRIHEEKDTLDWGERWERLEALVRPYRSRDGRTHDCIVPVSGAQDSYFLVHLVKERLGLHPLLVSYNKYFNTQLGIRNLAQLRIRFNCDILVQNVNPEAVKRITRTTLREFGSVYWPCLAGQSAFPVQTAVRFGIPLILWGAHQGLEQVGMFSHLHEVQMTRRYRKDHDLLGHEPDDLLSTFDTLTDADIWQYRYPDDRALDAVGVTGLYLGNYVRWDPRAQHEQMIASRGYRASHVSRTFDTYDHVDCFTYMGVHDLLKWYKHGYSRVTDHATREIRHGRMTRQQGVALVRQHEHGEAQAVDLFCEWLGVTRASLQFLLDRHRSPHAWTETSPGRWQFHGWSTGLPPSEEARDPRFLVTSPLHEKGAGYITVGKGHP
jgi:N-acetyl sugar amidotransferase